MLIEAYCFRDWTRVQSLAHRGLWWEYTSASQAIHAVPGFFDCVRLGPHCAQHDRSGSLRWNSQW